MIKDLIQRNRSYRRFVQSISIDRESIEQWINLARLSPSARNAQPLKYYISNTPEINAKIFPHLAWAGYLKEWDGPAEGERPSAYIVMLLDKTISESPNSDEGFAAQSILLGANEDGFGGCIIKSINKRAVHDILQLPGTMEIIMVIALGKPNEKVVIEEIKDGDTKYWRDEQETHHVPKRALQDIIIS
ncbi:MAG: nitroreductase family protein [Bacteroidota bacterium]|nr:nitroreductase family protein [Bacteroidota bacterium]MDP4204951.1 nitroreductase family protein [Bacteroidota bacterium]